MGFLVGGLLFHRRKMLRLITLEALLRLVRGLGAGSRLTSFNRATHWLRRPETVGFSETNQMYPHLLHRSSGEEQTPRKEVSDQVLKREIQKAASQICCLIRTIRLVV